MDDLTKEFEKILSSSFLIAKKRKHNFVDIVHLLKAFLEAYDSIFLKILNRIGIGEEKIRSLINKRIDQIKKVV